MTFHIEAWFSRLNVPSIKIMSMMRSAAQKYKMVYFSAIISYNHQSSSTPGPRAEVVAETPVATNVRVGIK
jgi:hypothetical protein